MLDKKIKGEIHKVDPEGRVVKPHYIRRDLNWQTGDVLQIFYNKDSIVLKKFISKSELYTGNVDGALE